MAHGERLEGKTCSTLLLQFHRESRELAVYAITVAPGSPKLTVTKASTTDLPNFIFRGFGDLFETNMTIKEVADGFQSEVMDRPVVDHTRLTGRYDFTLTWTPDDWQFAQFRAKGGPTPTAAIENLNASRSLYSAAQDQLGILLWNLISSSRTAGRFSQSREYHRLRFSILPVDGPSTPFVPYLTWKDNA